MKPLSKNAIAFVLAVLVIGALFSTYQLKNTKPENIGFSTLVERIQSGAVTSVEVAGSDITVTAADGSKSVA